MSKKHILVTGSRGFLGHKLIQALPELDMTPFDIMDGDAATFNFSVFNAQHIVHLAARTSVEESWNIPADYYRTNILGTLNVLEHCRSSGASMTYVSTYIYGKPQYLPIDEQHPVSPHSAYNHSKYMAEDICRFYAENFGVPVTVLRLFNLYGPGQGDTFIIPTIVKQALESERIELMDLLPKRDYIYIDDAVEALRLSTQCKGYNLYNVGSGCSVSVAELCEIVQECTGTNKLVISKGEARKNEVMDVVADFSKINRELAWEPRVPLREGIMRVVDYYQAGR